MIKTIKRSQINKAEYNPRTITDEHRAKLERSMQEFGMVGTFIWNERTGNLISGHQRLTILDHQQGYPGSGQDYELQVDALDLALDREKWLNMTLNSAEVSGTFSKDGLRKLLDDLGATSEIDLSALVIGEEKKSATKLKKLTAQKPPKMAWALVGIPVNRIEEIQAQVALISANPDTIVETTFN